MDNNIEYTTKDEVTHGRGYVYSLEYHIVWCTKYRKQIFNTENLSNEVKEYLNEISKSLEMTITQMEVMPDHIHLLVSARPQLRISDAIKVLKGTTSRWLFLAHPEIKKSLWGEHLWNPSYFVVTVSNRSHSQIEEYIKNQKKK